MVVVVVVAAAVAAVAVAAVYVAAHLVTPLTPAAPLTLLPTHRRAPAAEVAVEASLWRCVRVEACELDRRW